MAVEAVVALMVEKLDKLLTKEAQLLGVHGEIKHIQQELDQMRGFLEDADIKQKENEDVRDWMEDIRDICFDVDDVIDILGQGQAAQGRHGFVERLKGCISDQITRYKVGKEIERIKLNIKGISRRRESYGITETTESKEEPSHYDGTRDIDKGKLEAQADEQFSTRLGESEEVGSQEEINSVSEQLTMEEPSHCDGTRDIDEGRLEAQADGQFSTRLGESEEVGSQEEINSDSEQLTKEEPSHCDGTRDIDEGRLEAQADGQFSTRLGESEEVGSQEEIISVSEQLTKKEPSHCDGTKRKRRRMNDPFEEFFRRRAKEAKEAEEKAKEKERALQDILDSAPRLQELRRSVAPEKIEKAITGVDDQSTNEERTRDIDEGGQEASFSIAEKGQMSSEAVVPYIVGKLGDYLIQKAQLLFNFGVRKEVEWITNELEWMQCFLKDADSKINRDARVKKWVSDIVDVSYEIEDLIETFIDSESRRQGLSGALKKKRFVRVDDVAKQIEQIKKRIRVIEERRETYGISDINEGSQEASSWIRDLEGRRRDSVMFEEPQLVGQHEEFRTVRDQLMTEEQRRRVISIFGIGGSGKTALAKKILNDVKDHFDCHALVYVSQQCKFKDVLVRIIKGITDHSAPGRIEKMDEVDLGYKLRNEYLKGKRYLVVLDDIWTREAWDSLNLILPDDGNKSRVLVTTRNRDVALHADPSGYHHEMRLLNEDESWELFMKKIFPGKDPLTACPSVLEEKGKKILKKCGGLPLAILVLGGLLATKDKREEVWSKVLESIPESSKQCMDILALSYWDLPHYLKPCFLYMGLFPEDYEIGSGKLIRLWIAEGFIHQKGNKLMEDVAEDYLEELVSRSLIQIASKKSNGSIHKCRIHDLLRELSIDEATKSNFFAVHNDNDTSSSSTSVRRLAIYRNIDWDETKNNSIETLRSILYFFHSKVYVLKLPNTSSKLLRVMNVELEEYSEASIPKEVGEFVHLKFLEFSSKFSHNSIPPSIGNLSSLQTLKVPGHLPNTIWNLEELRHLHAGLVEGLSNLRNLQTLSLGAGSWINEGLGKLTNLRKLKISGDMSPYHDTLPYCIEKLCNLRSLKLHGPLETLIPPFQPFTLHLALYKILLTGRIEKLPEFPPNLLELTLYRSELKQDAIFTLEKLQHLKILRLMVSSYVSKQMICSPGGFPRLEFLELRNFPLEEWIVEEGAMISLKSVELTDMDELKTKTLPERVRALLKVAWRTSLMKKTARA